jgi:hypothetical protein
MYYSGIQQLVRRDPEYWLLYAMLREETNLISYLYYTKYMKPGDKIFFRHVDLNIAECVATGRGANAIQGSVSWDDEDDKNCTEMLDGFYNHIAEYQDWQIQQNHQDSQGKIEKWDDKKHWSDELNKR